MTTKTTSDNKKPQFIDNDLHGAYSGVDIHAYINLKTGQIKSIDINSLVLVSISTHRDKYPVTSCGRVGIKGITRGARTVAGTLVFHVGTKNAFQDIIKITPTPLGERMKFADDLPPFDLVITFVNEQGDASYATITGIDILDEGTTYSMDGINVFEQYSFMARSRTPMQSQFESSIAKTSLAVAEEAPAQKGLTSAETQNQNQLSRIQDTFNDLQADLLRVSPQLPIEEFRQPGETVPDSEFDKDFWDLPISPIFQDLVDSDNARNSG